jgi:hypothetical protein
MDSLMKIQVTQEHVDRARDTDHLCPVALAVQDKLGVEDVVVETKIIHWKNGGPFLLPWKVQKFLWRFDQGKHAEAFHFKLNMVEIDQPRH